MGALGVATAARAPDRRSRLGAPPFARDDLTRETAQKLYDGPDFQRPVGFELTFRTPSDGDQRIFLRDIFGTDRKTQ